MFGLTPQNVVIERTKEWVHARGTTYLTGHVSPPLGVVVTHDPVITYTPTLLLYDNARAW
jgi:hypothetical protein